MTIEDIALPTREGLEMIRDLHKQEEAERKQRDEANKKEKEERERCENAKKKQDEDSGRRFGMLPAADVERRMMKIIVGKIHNCVKTNVNYVRLSMTDLGYVLQPNGDGVVQWEKDCAKRVVDEINRSDLYSAFFDDWFDDLYVHIHDLEGSEYAYSNGLYWSTVHAYLLVFFMVSIALATFFFTLVTFSNVFVNVPVPAFAALCVVACIVLGVAFIVSGLGMAIEGRACSIRARLQMRKNPAWHFRSENTQSVKSKPDAALVQHVDAETRPFVG